VPVQNLTLQNTKKMLQTTIVDENITIKKLMEYSHITLYRAL
jgi:hypothetical protein